MTTPILKSRVHALCRRSRYVTSLLDHLVSDGAPASLLKLGITTILPPSTYHGLTLVFFGTLETK